MSIGFNFRILAYINRLTNFYRLPAFDIAAILLLLRNKFSVCLQVSEIVQQLRAKLFVTIQKNINQLVAAAVKLWKQEYKNEITTLKVEVTDIKVSQAFISKKHDDLEY